MKKRAQVAYSQGADSTCWHYIDKACVLACQVIWQYADREMEAMLAGMAQKHVKTRSFKGNNKKAIFFDSFGVTYILTIQYMKALVAMGMEVLYVYEERDHVHASIVPTLDIVRDYPGVEVVVLPKSKSKIQKLQLIYDSIADFEGSKIFTHIDTHSAVIPVLSVLPDTVTKYHINLGDHLYWLGAGFIDYTYEFRSFGAEVSRKKRGLRPEQTLFLPYYPIRETKEFQGFPKEAKYKVVLFTGGDFYKTIDKDNSYWQLLKAVVEENPSVIVLFAGKLENGNAPLLLRQFIERNGFEDRVIPIGFRADINEVFANCDIYMGTCPMSGGLMSQYAAANAKPILQYYPQERYPDNETESVICIHKDLSISFTDTRLFLDEAKRLIADASYRKTRGEEIQSAMITEEEFNLLFAQSQDTHHTPVKITEPGVYFDALTQWWIDIGNQGYYDAPAYVFSVLGYSGLKDAPFITTGYLIDRYLRKKVLNPGWIKSKVSGK